MSVRVCAGCSTRYAFELSACPHCGSNEVEGAATGRLPLFLSVACACGRAWNLRLNHVRSGLIELPRLFCASCGSQVQVSWPPVEDDMSPKITRSSGPSNARADETSPVVPASEPLTGAEAGQGRSNVTVVEPEAVEAEVEAVEPTFDDVQTETVEDVDYDAMSLAELKAAAEERGLPSYGKKSEIAQRLREADAGA